MALWLDKVGSDSDVVLSTRVRLARNLKNHRFPSLAPDAERKEIKKSIGELFSMVNGFEVTDFDGEQVSKFAYYLDRHLISKEFLDRKLGRLLITNPQKSTSIMINEEDHIRIQSIIPGFDLDKALEEADKVDDLCDEMMELAFNKEFGYLTACPTNLGTGMRASVMVHLPALVLTGEINRIWKPLDSYGMTVRGIYGEGSEALGNIYQISNQVTLGQSEEAIMANLESAISQLIKRERQLRNTLFESHKLKILDKVNRAIGLLKYARLISSKESMELLSDLRFGIYLGEVSDIDIPTMNKLMVDIQPLSLEHRYGKGETISEEKRDELRGNILRERFRS